MTRRGWLLLGGGFALAVAIPWGLKVVHARQEQGAYQEQLRLARAEGLPTNAQEYEAFIEPAESFENAAFLYQRLRGARPKGKGFVAIDFTALDRRLNFASGGGAVAEVREQLALYEPTLRLVDEASQLPRCWFGRDWIGVATLFPEYAEMKTAAKIVALRGSLAAHEGRVADALDDAQRIFAVARHAGEEPHQIARLVREAIYAIGVRDLAYWAFTHRDRPEYGKALQEAVAALPTVNLKDEHRMDLYNVLSTIELCSTPEGRAELGLKEEDVSSGAEQIFPLLLSQSKSRIKIVEAVREGWAALDRPVNERPALESASKRKLYQALLAFPTAARVYEMLSSGGSDEEPPDREVLWEAKHQMDIALARALRGPAIPKSMPTVDLPSPFDGKPLTYSFDGKQIRISVSGSESGGGPKPLVIPPSVVP